MTCPWRKNAIGWIFIIFACSPIPAQSQEYARYCNARYGFCLEYPGHLIPDTPPENGDGRKFHDKDGFMMISAGINNVLEDGLNSEMSLQGKDFDTITYRAHGKKWFVLSGYKGSSVLYRKTFVGKGSINSLYMQYPSQSAAAYGKMVTGISRSFKPGDLARAH